MTGSAPDPALTACMLQRAGDLAHVMLQRGQEIAVASGHTPNGHPCTVILAIGWSAEMAREVGARLVAEVVKSREQAKQN